MLPEERTAGVDEVMHGTGFDAISAHEMLVTDRGAAPDCAPLTMTMHGVRRRD